MRALEDVDRAAKKIRSDRADDRGFGFARQMALDGKMMPKEVSKILDTLNQMPKGMRDIAIKSMVHFTAGLEASGQLPKSATDKLIDRLEDRWGELPKKVEKQAQKLADGVKKGPTAPPASPSATAAVQ